MIKNIICAVLWALLGTLVFILYREQLLSLSIKYKPVFEVINILVSILISAGLFALAVKANKIASEQSKATQQKISKEHFDLIKGNYDKVSEAKNEIFANGDVTDKSLQLLWQARDDARLYLPKDIAEYTEELRAKASKGKQLNRRIKGLAVGTEERSEAVDEQSDIVDFFIELQPHEAYRKHITQKDAA